MSEVPDTELSRRLRANWGRRLRPEFVNRFEAALDYEAVEMDFADLMESDRLGRELLAHLRDLKPSLTWPEARREDVFTHLVRLSERLDDRHESYLVFFGGWEYIGALRVRSRAVLAAAQDLWQQERERVCLITANLADGLFLDYTDPAQMFGADEYELCVWGEFAASE